MKKSILLMFILCIAAVSIYPYTGSFTFTRDGIGAEETAMGGAGVAGIEGPDSMYWNPAGLTRINSYIWQISTMYTVETYDRHYAYIGAANHTEEYGDFGISLINFGIANIDIFDNAGLPAGTENDEEFIMGASYGNKVNYQLRYGVTLKGLFQDLVGYKALGYSMDIGLMFQPLLEHELYFGLMLQNVLGTAAWENTVEDVLSVYKAGMSWKLFDDIMKINADVVKEEGDDSMVFKAGLEFKILDYRFVRGGIDGSYPSAGLGVRWESYSFDYAYVYNKYDFGDIHQVSFAAMW